MNKIVSLTKISPAYLVTFVHSIYSGAKSNLPTLNRKIKYKINFMIYNKYSNSSFSLFDDEVPDNNCTS